MSNANEMSLRPRPGETAEQAVERVIAAAKTDPRFPVDDEQPEGERTQLNVTIGDLDNLRRLEDAQRQLKNISTELFHSKTSKRYRRDEIARLLNAIAASLHTVELNLGGGS